MADKRDPQVSRRYRELGSEEPPRALDEAILAASRRSVTLRRRWFVPLAAAVVAVLAVGIVLQIERQSPDAEDRVERRDSMTRDAAPPAAAPSGEAASKPETARKRERSVPMAPVPQTAPARMRAEALEETPEAFLKRIAGLRQEGRHEEADKALAEFRQRYPAYRIPQTMLEQLERK